MVDRRVRRAQVIAAALIGVVVVVIVAVSAAHHGPTQPEGFTSPSFAPSRPDASVTVQRVLDVFNADQVAKGVDHAFVPEYGPSRCWAGFSADFPDQLLVTMIRANGFWMQLFVDPTKGLDQTSISNGPDYTAAGIDPSSFDATGYPCQVASDGSISMVP